MYADCPRRSSLLRKVHDSDLPVFFRQMSDPESNLRMAAFTRKDPTDRDAFDAHWERIRVLDGRHAHVLADGDGGRARRGVRAARGARGHVLGRPRVLGPRRRHGRAARDCSTW